MADTTPTLREAAQQAMEALAPLANATTPAEREALTDADAQAADAASCDLRAALAEQDAEYDVRTILLGVVPGDGSGREVYAKSVNDVHAVLTRMGERIEELESRLAAPAAEQAEPVAPQKYDDTLMPFLHLMRTELHANAAKGDRPGWLSMDRNTALLEIYWHTAKLSAAVKNNNHALIAEHSADVANMAMMLADVCGVLPEYAPPAPARQEWQPIETAPRAGNVIVAAPMEAGGYYVGEAWFSEDSDQWWPANVDPTDAHGSPIYPTLWQPLPAAPITAAPAEGGA